MVFKMDKKMLARILISAALLIAAVLIPSSGWVRLLIFLVPYLVIGWDVLFKAVRNIFRGKVFDEHFLMAVATIGAFLIGIITPGADENAEAVVVMLFYQIGEFFQDYAVGRTRESVAKLMDIRPDYANLVLESGLKKVSPEEVGIDDVIAVKPGEKIPLDGVILEGASALNTSALTGESLPRDVREGDEAISGCVNLTGLLKIRVTKPFGESTVSKILDLVENASGKKAKSEKFITKFARYYTPIVVIAAALLAVLPPLLFGGVWTEWIHRALIFLVISCPCALVISVPLSFFGGIGGASKNGILIKGSNYVEALSQVKTVVFDKTGTLTKGTFSVTAVHPDKISEEELLQLTALAESYSDHPISQSLKNAYGKPLDAAKHVENYEELTGRGVRATVDGQTVCAGNDKLMEEAGASWRPCHHIGTTVHVAVNGEYAGHIIIADELKPGAEEAVRRLKNSGVRKVVMLTGDSKAVGGDVAKKLGIDEVHAELLPAGKVEKVEELLAAEAPGEKLMFVGDGINDAPVISRADVGGAMGALGSDAAIEAADVVLMDGNPKKLASAIAIARKTMGIVKQNILFALAVKAAILVLGAVGFANMWLAVFADVGVSLLAVLNAMRALYSGDKD